MFKANTQDEMLAILQAHMQHRRIQCIRRVPDDNDTLAWRQITNDHLLNFEKFVYRFAPVDAECWLLFNTRANQYVMGICGADSIYAGSTDDRQTIFTSAGDAAKQANTLNEIYAVRDFVPVKVRPSDDTDAP